MAPFGESRGIRLAIFVTRYFWNSAPIGDLEQWLKARVPADLAPILARNLDGARFQFAEKERLVQAADRYLESAPEGHSHQPE